MNGIQQRKHRIQKLNTMEICDILLTIGLSLILLEGLLDAKSIVRIMMHILGSITLLIGMAVFVAIARRVLDY